MNHTFKKRFGQNFLTDKNLISKIVSAAKISDQHVIEIGPGQGALTKELVKYAKKVTAYEIDSSLAITLDELVKQNSNLEVIYQDILIAELNKEDEISVIGNIPYNITTPIIFKLTAYDNIKSITLMMQEEVADRILAKSSTKEYNALSVILQEQYQISKIVKVNKKLFYPIPKVDSVVIQMIPVKTPEKGFINFVKAAFSQKRKTLANNLFNTFNIPKEKTQQVLHTMNLNENIRAEAIEQHMFKKLMHNINDM